MSLNSFSWFSLHQGNLTNKSHISTDWYQKVPLIHALRVRVTRIC